MQKNETRQNMKKLLFAFAALIFMAACGNNQVLDAKSQENKEGNEVIYEVAHNYFFKNDIGILPENPKITSEEEFNKLFGMATTMGQDGKPTEIDFTKQFVLAIVLPVTEFSTEINPEKVVEKGDSLLYHFEVKTGEKQTFSIQPISIIILDKKYENKEVVLVNGQEIGVMSANSQAPQNNIVAEGEVPVRVSDLYSFTEGPAVDAKGDVFFTDQPNNKIYHWDCISGEITLFTNQSGRSNGMYFDDQGNLIACADMDNQLWSFDMKGNSKILITDFCGKLLNGPNDVWISKDGSYYLTDPYFKRDYWKRNPARQQPVEGLYYLAPGDKQLIMLDSTLNQPNGIVGTPDGKHLFVAEAKANRILKYDILSNGRLSNRQVFADMGSDGMTIDDRGNVYVTGDGVTVFKKNGQKIAHFPIPEAWTSNVCFGGKERDILFITASKSVYTLKMLVHGVK